MLFESMELEDERKANCVIHIRHKAPEKRNRNVLLSWQKPLPLFSQKFTQGLATSDAKGNVQLILSFS